MQKKHRLVTQLKNPHLAAYIARDDTVLFAFGTPTLHQRQTAKDYDEMTCCLKWQAKAVLFQLHKVALTFKMPQTSKEWWFFFSSVNYDIDGTCLIKRSVKKRFLKGEKDNKLLADVKKSPALSYQMPEIWRRNGFVHALNIWQIVNVHNWLAPIIERVEFSRNSLLMLTTDIHVLQQ